MIMSFWKTKIDPNIVYAIEHCNEYNECNKQYNEEFGFPKCIFSRKEFLQYYLACKHDLEKDLK